MRTRIVIGSGAWLLGAAAATAGGLYVVSELGEGISASPASQQSSVAAAVQAQASQAAAPSSSTAPRSQRSTGAKSGAGGAGTGGSGASGRTASTSGTVLSSSGGTVVAQCAATGAFLLSWSPQQGFTASSVALRAGHHRPGRVHHHGEHGDHGGVLHQWDAIRRDHRDERRRPCPVGDGR